MKKILIAILIIGVSVLLISCNIHDNSVTSTLDDNANSYDDGETSLTDYQLDANEDTSFKLGQDDQPFFISKMGMKISNGDGEYTFVNEALYYYDNASKQAVNVCGKPNCDHKTNVNEGESDCDSFFPDTLYYYDKGYSFYNDYLYMLGRGNNNEAVSLYKISSDASTREEVCKLFEISDFNNIGIFTIHRNYAFWSLNTQEGARLFRMNLEDLRQEQMFSTKKNAAYIMRFIGAGDYLYFSHSYATDESFDNWETKVCRLNIHSGKSDELLSTEGCYTVFNNKIYYIDSGKLFQSNLNGSNVVDLGDVPDNSWLIVNDSEYLYLTNWDNEITEPSKYKVFVLDNDGKLIDTIDISNGSFIGGYKDNLFIGLGRQLIAYDKKQIGTGKFESKVVYTISDTGEIVLDE